MKISLITVTYNAAPFLETCIRSVLEQDYPDIEYLVIDGKSTDGTLDIIEKYRSRINVLVSEKDNGLYDALNKGISLATGDVVGVLHADDFFASPEILRKIATQLTATGADVLYGSLDYVDAVDTSKITRKWRSKQYSHGMFQRGWMPAHPTFYVKRELFDRLGAYKHEFGSAADYELMIRFLHKHRVKATFLTDVIVKMRVGGMSNSSVKNRVAANRADLAAMEVNGIRFPRIAAFLKPLRKLPQFLGF